MRNFYKLMKTPQNPPTCCKVKQDGDYPQMFKGLGLGLMVILMFTFSTTNALGFYVSFEASLIPTLMWVATSERVKLFHEVFDSSRNFTLR